MPAPSRRRARIAAATSILLVLCAMPAAAAMAGWTWSDSSDGQQLSDALWMSVLSLIFAVAGIMRVVAEKG
jgi:hypothetical protein